MVRSWRRLVIADDYVVLTINAYKLGRSRIPTFLAEIGYVVRIS